MSLLSTYRVSLLSPSELRNDRMHRLYATRRRTLAAIDADRSLDLVLHAGDLSYADCDHVRLEAAQFEYSRHSLCTVHNSPF